ncbi:hypothetical protein [Massilibacterium senegalense]|uniref:hypothetical protein n=1 Tax=Massilibacterium senegalense TaxID=1632858 RepID=UPI00078566C6
MFLSKVDDDLSLKLIELRDAERIFELTNQSRAYLTSLRKKSPTSKREGAATPVKVGDELRLGAA